MKRYDVDQVDCECADGDYVLYADHLADRKRREQALRDWMAMRLLVLCLGDQGNDDGVLLRVFEELEDWLDAGGLEEK